MLPDLRFVFGALMIIAITGMIGVGLFVSARLFNQAKMGPIESGRNLAFTDSAEWNQFYEPGSVRRFVGLARQGEAREIGDLPPEHRSHPAAPAALAVDLAPVEVAEQDDGVETAPLSVRPSVVADPAAADVAPPQQKALAVAAPSMPDQTSEASVTERTPVVNADTVAEIKPGAAETVVVHSVPMPIRSEPAAADEPAGTRTPGSTDGSAAGAIAVETQNRSDQEPSGTTPAATTEMSDPAAVTGKVKTATAAAPETALPQRQKASPPAAPHPPAAVAKVVAPARTARTPVKRAVRDDDDEDERPRAASPARKRTLASRPRTAPQVHAPQRNGTQRVDARQPPPGQPVFGPNFPYATPQSRQPVFGPHFPYATPQARRQPAERAPQYRTYSQPSYGAAYGWR